MRYESVSIAGKDGSIMLSKYLEDAGTIAVRVSGYHRLDLLAEQRPGKLEYRTDTFRPGQLAEATLHAAKLIYGKRRDGYAECTNSEAFDVRDLLQRMGLED